MDRETFKELENKITKRRREKKRNKGEDGQVEHTGAILQRDYKTNRHDQADIETKCRPKFSHSLTARRVTDKK